MRVKILPFEGDKASLGYKLKLHKEKKMKTNITRHLYFIMNRTKVASFLFFVHSQLNDITILVKLHLLPNGPTLYRVGW